MRIVEVWIDRLMPHVGALLLLFLFVSPARAQFAVHLNLDYESAVKTIELYQGLAGHPDGILRLRGSRIALATTALLAQKNLDESILRRSLEASKFGQTISDDTFRMKWARENVALINELLTAIKRRNFGQRVMSTVEQLFPSHTKLATSIPVYFVAFGHQNIDAFVRRVVWKDDTPYFVGEGEGELTIVVNLANAVYYGRTTDERFVGTLSVVAHEVFHAAFGVYRDNSSVWREYYATHRTYFDQLLDLTQNEGIAHYLTLEQRSRGSLPPDWDEKARSAFADFNKNAGELLSARISPQRANELIRTSNTATYWESYGAITGMVIARQIDLTLGRLALAETIANGPNDFFIKYIELVNRDNNLPALSHSLQRHIKGN